MTVVFPYYYAHTTENNSEKRPVSGDNGNHNCKMNHTDGITPAARPMDTHTTISLSTRKGNRSGIRNVTRTVRSSPTDLRVIDTKGEITFVVPFDGSDLAEAALVRAVVESLRERVRTLRTPRSNTSAFWSFPEVGTRRRHRTAGQCARSGRRTLRERERWARRGAVDEVGVHVANEDASDVFIVRQSGSPKVDAIEPRADF